MSFADTRCVRPNPSLAGMYGVRGNPLDVFERLSIAENYDFERVNPMELHMSVPGLWCENGTGYDDDCSCYGRGRARLSGVSICGVGRKISRRCFDLFTYRSGGATLMSGRAALILPIGVKRL